MYFHVPNLDPIDVPCRHGMIESSSVGVQDLQAVVPGVRDSLHAHLPLQHQANIARERGIMQDSMSSISGFEDLHVAE